MKSKLLSALLAFVIALGIWAYVITVENPEGTETYYNVPVVLKSTSLLEERQLMIIDGGSPTITLELKGNRSYLKKLSSSDIIVVAELSGVYEAGVQKLTYDVSYPGTIPDNSLQIMSQEPAQISLTLANKTSKNVPVVVKFVGSVPEDYVADKDNPVLSHTEISVKGPDTVINQIEEAYIEVDLTERVESVNESYRYTLRNADGEPVDAAMVTTNTEEVNLEVKIQRKKEIQLKVNVVDGGGATEQTSNITISPESIWVAGSDAALSNLDELILGTINLGEITTSTSFSLDVELPEGVENLSNVTTASVRVSFPKLKTREFTITSIKAANVPEGMKADVLTTQIKVSIRGPKDIINSMTLGDITATVNLADQEQGTFSAAVTILLSEKFTECGQVGTSSVSVTLSPDEDTKT